MPDEAVTLTQAALEARERHELESREQKERAETAEVTGMFDAGKPEDESHSEPKVASGAGVSDKES